MQFAKKIAISFIALIVLFSQLAISLGDLNASANGNISLRVGLKDEIFTKSERVTFDVWARDELDQKIENDFVVVTNNGEDVPINWTDEVKTSYTATLTEGSNEIEVYVDYNGQQLERTIHVTYEYAEYGDVIGEYTFSMDGFVVGLGYFIEPMKIPIINGENAALHLERTLYEHGFSSTYSGSPESGYYLSSILEGNLLDKPYPPEIPQAVRDAGDEWGGAYIDEYSYTPEEYGIGEFDFNYMSGWMYAVNNVFPNVGFSDYYLMDEDVMRVQYTVAYGSDIGGGYAMGGTEDTQYFPHVNKDFLTEIAATINSSPFKAALYANTGLETHYKAALDTLAIVDITQAELDAAEAELRALYEDALVVAITTTIDGLPENALQSERTLMELIRYQLDKLSTSQLAAISNLERFEALENLNTTPQHVQVVIDQIAALPATITLENGTGIEQVFAAYNALSADEKELVTNAQTVIDAQRIYSDMQQANVVDERLLALPKVADFQLADEQVLLTASQAYEALTEQQKAYVENADIIQALTEQLALLKQQESERAKDVAAADSVEQLISKLPAEGDLKLSDAASLEAAQKAYEELTEKQKTLVENANILQALANKLTALKAAAVSVAKLIEKLPAKDNVQLSEGTNILAAYEAYNKLSADEKALVLNAATLEEVYSQYNDIKIAHDVDSKITALPSVSKLTVDDEDELIEALNAYQSLTDAQKKLVQNAGILIELQAALVELKEENATEEINEQKAQDVVALINDLPAINQLSVSFEGLLQTINTKYSMLTTEQQKLVTNAAKLQQATEKMQHLKAADAVQTLINKLPSVANFKLEHEQQLNAANEAYKALTAEQKTFVQNAANIESLLQRLAELKEEKADQAKILAAVEPVELLISKLPTKDEVELSHASAITEAYKAFNALIEDYQLYVFNKKQLIEAYDALQVLQKIDALNKKLASLPPVNELKLEDEKQLNEAVKSFNELTLEQQKLVQNATLLITLNSKLQELKVQQNVTAVENIKTAIAGLPATAKLTDEMNYNNIKAAYDALKPEQQLLVTNVDVLKAFGEKLAALKGNNDQAIIDEVVFLIDNLPMDYAVTLQQEATILMVEKTFNSLTKAQQAKVINSSKLSGLLAKIAELKAKQQGEAAIKQVVDAITAIPNAVQITLTNKQYIQSVRAKYEALTFEQKARVTGIEKLMLAEFKIQELEASVSALVYEINSLPAVITVQHAAIVQSLRASFDALSITQKMAVVNITKLLDAEQKLKTLDITVKPEAPQTTTSEDLKEAMKDSEGITAIEGNEQSSIITIEADQNSTKPATLSTALMDKIQKMKAATVVLNAKHNIHVEIPTTVFATGLSKNASFEVDAKPYKVGIQPSVKVAFTEILSNGIKRDLSFAKQYVTVKLPLSLFNKAKASTTMQATEQGVILRKTADGFEAVPHKIVNGEAIIFANTNAEYVYSTHIVTFNDIAKLRNKEDIEFLASRYVVKGYSQESFAPNKSITRSQFAVMIARSLNLIAQEDAVYTDTKGKTYEEAVQALYEAGITNAKGKFKPSSTLTREQAASFMYRVLKYANYDFKENQKSIKLKDLGAINANHLPAVLALYELEIMTGKADGNFDPKGHLTRAQMAKILRLTLKHAGMM